MGYKKKIIVTGGAGFIGSNFLNKFVPLYPDYLFINIDALTYAGKLSNIKVSEEKNYIFKKTDIRKIKELEKIFIELKPDNIIHFAAESHVDLSIDTPDLFVATNVVGTHNLLMLAKKHNIKRFYQISTDEVYGSLLKDEPAFTKDSLLAPNSPYSASKASADMLVRSYHQTFGLGTITSRCSNNYGPNQDESKLIPKCITLLLKNKKIPIYSKGENVRDWIYVDDHIDAIIQIFHEGKDGGVYNIGGNCEMTNLEIAKILLNFTNKDESYIDYITDRRGHDFRYAIDISEIKNDLGWQPKYSFEEGIRKTFEYYENL